MAKKQRIPERSEVRTEHTWDLAPLYKSDEEWEADLNRLEKKAERISDFRGTLGKSAKNLYACCAFETELGQEMEKLGEYVFLKSTENVADSKYQGMLARFMRMATRAEEAASFIAPEIRSIPKKRMQEFLEDPVLQNYRFHLEKLLRYRPHILSEKEERILAMQGEIADTAEKVFDQLNDADMKFGFVKDEEGIEVELSHGSFRGLLESPRRAVRRKAFERFYAQYEAHANTVAAALSSSVLKDIYYARVRNHPSALEAALFADKVEPVVYENLIRTVHENLPVVYRYLELRRKVLRVKDLRFYDTYVPLVKDMKTHTPYEEAAGTVVEALAPLGGAYCKTLEKGLNSGRWVDRFENKGKRSGAFSSGSFLGPPYILMNYKPEVLDSMFTLAHEAGHSMHSHLSASNQPFQYYHYRIFVAEVASTFNEQLLNRHLLNRAEDDRMRALLLTREIDEIRGTLVRQTMFAEFEKVIHDIAEADEPLTLDVFRAEYRKLLERYFGPDFVIDQPLELEGLRIPHFYRAFYVYKYATGISAAVALSQKVMEGNSAERDSYLSFLKGGGSKYPLDLLRDAGVDMSKPDPIATTMRRLDTLVHELEDIL